MKAEQVRQSLDPDGKLGLVAPSTDDAGVFSLPPEGILLRSLADLLTTALGFPDAVSAIPAQLLPASVVLRQIAIHPADNAFRLVLAWQTSWELIPSAVHVNAPVITLEGTPDGCFGQLDAVVNLGDVPFTMSVEVPSFRASAKLLPLLDSNGLQQKRKDGTNAAHRVGSLLAHFGLDFPAIEKLELAGAGLEINPRSSILVAYLTLDEVLEVGNLKIETLSGYVRYVGGDGGMVEGLLGGAITLTLGGIDYTLQLTAERRGGPTGGWLFNGSLTFSDTTVQFTHLIKGIGGGEADIPADLGGISLGRLLVSYDTATHNIVFTAEGDFPIGASVSAQISVDVHVTTLPDNKNDIRFEGRLTIHDLEFDLLFDKDPTGKCFAAQFRNPGGQMVQLSDLVADVVSDLSFNLKEAVFGHQTLALQQVSKSSNLFALNMDVGVNLSGLGNLPLIGQALDRDQALTLAFQVLAGPKSKPGQTTDWSKLADLVPDAHVPADFQGEFKLHTTLHMGELTRLLEVGIDGDNTKDFDQAKLGSPSGPPPVGTGTPPADPASKVAANTNPQTNVQWVDLQKHFGPLLVQRVGVGYESPKIDVLLDAALAIGPLSVALDGLGAEYDLKVKTLEFSLQGAALAFSRPPLEISGAFLRMGYDFAGEATLRAENFTISALGMIGEVQGHPSLFIYASLNYGLGGPPFFYVEGLAAGFGVNRRLIMPPIQEIHNFPLVTAAISGEGTPQTDTNPAALVKQRLQSLEQYVPPQLGETFFAAGVHFNSFKIIDCFALLALSVGNEFELDVLGVATLTQPAVPPGTPPKTRVIAKAQLEFVVRYAPAEGILAAQAQLTPASFVFDPLCHLQGGFAYYNWFSGEQAGDFVTTLGGYHPSFQPPKHYPVVPRLGFNWQVNPQVLIKGKAYFAMTPHAIMAGGSLNATYDSGDIHAWFILGADFLMYWKPFHYTASAEVEIGASLTVHCFGTHTLTISAGADLQIWGPPFAGRAEVHVKVLIVHVSFTVPFGDGSPTPPPKIDWHEFQKSFLHEADKAPEKICRVAIQGGLLRTVKDDGKKGASKGDGKNGASAGGQQRWIVNPKELCLVTDSLIPSSQLKFIDHTTTQSWTECPLSESTEKVSDNLRVGIEPMGVTKSEFVSQQLIRVMRKGKDVSADFAFIPAFKQVPSALWNPNASPTSSPGLNQPQLTQALTGYQMHPATPATPGETSPIRDDTLQYEVTPRDLVTDRTVQVSYKDSKPLQKDLSWSQGDGGQRLKASLAERLKASLAETKPTESRRKLLEQLGFFPARDVALHKSLADSFVLPPQFKEVSIT